jgi:serine phosphatase RsbU (regulator of sigma subunit)
MTSRIKVLMPNADDLMLLLSRGMEARYSIILALAMALASGLTHGQTLHHAISLQYNAPDSAIALAEAIANSTANDTLKSNALEVVGIASMVMGQFPASFNAHSEALLLRRQIGWRSGIGHSLNNMGLVTHRLGNLEEAMKLFLNCLKIAEEIPDSVLLTRVYGNIGNIYEEQGDLDRALQYYVRGLEVLKSSEASHILANTLHNVALVHSRQGSYDTALVYWHRALHTRETLKDERGKAHALNNMGSLIYASQRLYTTADSLYDIAYHIYERLNDPHGMSMVSGSMGSSAFHAGKAKEAITLCERSLALAKDHGFDEYARTACLCLADAYSSLGQYQKANQFLRDHIRLVVDADVVVSGRKAALMEQRYEHEKEQLRQQTLADEELKRQQLMRNMSIILGILGFLLFLVQYDSYRKKQRANLMLQEKNTEILHQKELIAEKNKEVTDSIRYAQRLQQARLPKSEDFARLFACHHILYLPKDIVSGDFYWLEEANGHTYVAVADCTGHGVPGAMVSMVGIQGLNRAVLELGMTSPSAILTFLSQHMEEAFNKGESTVRDGMDMALCIIPADRSSISFAGANNSLIQITQRSEMKGAILRSSYHGSQLFEWKADRRSIGGHNDNKDFTEHTVSLSTGDKIALCSDGYADQFGGARNRKFSSNRLRELILQSTHSGNWQLLNSEFAAWKGTYEQIDDVTVLVLEV